MQLTYSGLPTYYWFKDIEKNNFSGDGVGNAWSLILKDIPSTVAVFLYLVKAGLKSREVSHLRKTRTSYLRQYSQ
ncbi:hypothetical protein [Photobacterium piscicola]|uniref:hypothetical protein n=1 Tax=Photobacterium piscicola TaxID=1378299 RepID=UPI003AF31D44